MVRQVEFWPTVSNALALFAGTVGGSIATLAVMNAEETYVLPLVVFSALALAYLTARRIRGCKAPLHRVGFLALGWGAFISGVISPIALLGNPSFHGSYMPMFAYALLLAVSAIILHVRAEGFAREDI